MPERTQAKVRMRPWWTRRMIMSDQSGNPTIVVGASRGLGRAIATALAAAVNKDGSPLSGGYAGAKATQRFITAYAQDQSRRAGLGITFTTVLPQFAPLTGVGKPAVAAYAAQADLSVDDFLSRQTYPLL